MFIFVYVCLYQVKLGGECVHGRGYVYVCKCYDLLHESDAAPKRDSLQAEELSRRFWKTAVQIMSIPPAPSNGARLTVLDKPAIRTRWIAGTTLDKGWRC